MATRWDNLPGMSDDVMDRAKEDLAKAKKGRDVDSSNLKGGAKESVREAGARARNRNMGRAGLAGLALEAGYGLGRAIDEKTGVGKKIVEKSGLGDVVDKVVNMRDKVKLSQREKEGADDSDASDKFEARRSEGDFGMKRGGKVSSASSRADGIAQRGKTKGRYL